MLNKKGFLSSFLLLSFTWTSSSLFSSFSPFSLPHPHCTLIIKKERENQQTIVEHLLYPRSCTNFFGYFFSIYLLLGGLSSTDQPSSFHWDFHPLLLHNLSPSSLIPLHKHPLNLSLNLSLLLFHHWLTYLSAKVSRWPLNWFPWPRFLQLLAHIYFYLYQNNLSNMQI